MIDMNEEKIVVRCSSCERPLMNYIVIGQNSKPFKFQATCPFCNGSSDIIDICGTTFTGPIDKSESSNPTVIADIVCEEINTFIITKAKG